jgi:hypothetical protein
VAFRPCAHDAATLREGGVERRFFIAWIGHIALFRDRRIPSVFCPQSRGRWADCPSLIPRVRRSASWGFFFTAGSRTLERASNQMRNTPFHRVGRESTVWKLTGGAEPVRRQRSGV